jgi:crotonobetainyl-CoA:carnitine CoA-transferase CaiB-like acyl-CoA transferase
VKADVRAVIKKKTKEEWCGLFKATDACVEPVMTLKEVFEDTLAKERGLIVELPVVCGGTVKQIASPIKFSDTKQVYKSAGVTVKTGNHTKEIFRELGYTEDEIEAFVKTGLFN